MAAGQSWPPIRLLAPHALAHGGHQRSRADPLTPRSAALWSFSDDPLPLAIQVHPPSEWAAAGVGGANVRATPAPFEVPLTVSGCLVGVLRGEAVAHWKEEGGV